MLTSFGSVIQENEFLHFIIWPYTVIFKITTTSTVDLPVNINISCLCCKSSKGYPVTNVSGFFCFVFCFFGMTLFPIGVPSAPVYLSEHVHFCILILSSDQSGGSPGTAYTVWQRKTG